MTRLTKALTLWTGYAGIVLFIFFSSTIEINNASTTSEFLLGVSYYLGFGVATLTIFMALVYSWKFSVDRLSRSKSKREDKEDDEFRLIIELLLLIISISANISVILINHNILKYTKTRESDIYAILINILSVSSFALLVYVWPYVNPIERVKTLNPKKH